MLIVVYNSKIVMIVVIVMVVIIVILVIVVIIVDNSDQSETSDNSHDSTWGTIPHVGQSLLFLTQFESLVMLDRPQQGRILSKRWVFEGAHDG